MMCLLVHSAMPHMQFLFVSTIVCSPAYFRYNITVITLVPPYAGLKLRSVTSAFKSLSLSGFLISPQDPMDKNYIYHSGHTQKHLCYWG